VTASEAEPADSMEGEDEDGSGGSSECECEQRGWRCSGEYDELAIDDVCERESELEGAGDPVDVGGALCALCAEGEWDSEWCVCVWE
jgi:hypothetical protein